MKKNKLHNKSRSPEYSAWRNAKSRCLNVNHPRFKDYGGRGITFHKLWINDFPAFFREVGMKPSDRHDLDRKDNSKGYEPGNVKWSTRKENIKNRKRPCERCGYHN